MDELVRRHSTIMDKYDPAKKVALIVDEWGTWYAVEPGTHPRFLYQQNTMRDALLAGLTLDTFNRHADKVAMANVAQLVSCLQSLFLAHEDKFCVTPTYHVFNMYASHQGAQAVRSVFSAAQLSYQRNGQPASLYGLNGSASLNGKQLTLTVTNPSMDQARAAEISLRGAIARSARIVTLAASDVHAFNSFENPQAVQSREQTIAVSQSSFTYQFPPASVVKLEITLV